MTAALSYLRWPIGATVIGLVLATWLGWAMAGGVTGALSFLVIGAVLAVLEISLSFDNAIVNANRLERMTPVWQRRFLTWGILIAVFGMRIVFPVLVVAIAAGISPFAAVELAAARPGDYARIIGDAHVSIAAFGGTFLMMVSLTYFLDQEKEVDWIRGVEKRMRACGSVRGFEIAFVLALVVVFAYILPPDAEAEFVFASICGLLAFTGVEVISRVLDATEKARTTAAQGGLGAFLYLEMLDASFSFDGVIGAFALTTNLFLIAIGLGIGAFYVRSMTIMLVERRTLAHFRYIEHGAFYSILALSLIMYVQSIVHIPEMITGLIGAGLIGLSFYSSIRYNARRQSRDGTFQLASAETEKKRETLA